MDFHETGFVNGLNAENRQGFWFQLTQAQRQEANAPWGPQNPQALNRYAYVQNNPLRYTDPSGHSVYLSQAQAETVAQMIDALITHYRTGESLAKLLHAIAGVADVIDTPVGIFLHQLIEAAGMLNEMIVTDLDNLRKMIRAANTSADGVAIATQKVSGELFARVAVLDRRTGNMFQTQLSLPTYYGYIPYDWELGFAHGNWREGHWWFAGDVPYQPPLAAPCFNMCG